MGGRPRHLVIFLRAPQRGAVKRRLAAAIGQRAAHAFYAGQSGALVSRLSTDRRWRTVLAVTPDGLAGARFWPRHIPRRRQGGGDLGTRMGRIFESMPPGPVVIVGADIPAVAPAHVAAAFDALARAEAVFGPALDGGYWLVGLARRRLAPAALLRRLFRGVRWSSLHALADTRANLPGGAEGPVLEMLRDVDDRRDFDAFVMSESAGKKTR